MQGHFGETINGSEYSKRICNAIQRHLYLQQFITYIFEKVGGKNFVKGNKFSNKSINLIGLIKNYNHLQA